MTYVLELVPRMRKSHWALPIVMAVVIAVALVPATAFLEPAPPGARPSTPDEFVMVPPATNGPEMLLSLGYLEHDWSSAKGRVPGFALLSDNSN